ncbi:hypothetical protein JGS39_34375, partial [Streptomyces sp. P01-B04]|nr:hypothetical protein [Streptomyces poriferorum]
LQAGALPDLPYGSTDWVPVDYVSAAVVALSVSGRTDAQTYHFTNPEAPGLDRVFEAAARLGHELRTVPAEQWQARVAAQPDNAAQLFLGDEGQTGHQATDRRRFDSRWTADAAEAVGVRQPPLTDETLIRYLTYFHESGFLPAPGVPATAVQR